jgi:hypothetical protein
MQFKNILIFDGRLSRLQTVHDVAAGPKQDSPDYVSESKNLGYPDLSLDAVESGAFGESLMVGMISGPATALNADSEQVGNAPAEPENETQLCAEIDSLWTSHQEHKINARRTRDDLKQIRLQLAEKLYTLKSTWLASVETVAGLLSSGSMRFRVAPATEWWHSSSP